MRGCVVRALRAGDRAAVLALYAAAFGRIHAPALRPLMLAAYGDALASRRVLVAVDGAGAVVGFAAWIALEAGVGRARDLDDALWVARAPRRVEAARRGLAAGLPVGAGAAQVIAHPAGAATPRRVRSGDVYLSELVVDGAWRGRGVGRALMRARMEAVREGGEGEGAGERGGVLFVHCWDGGPARRLYARRGFEAILEVRPAHADGSGWTLMTRAGVPQGAAGSFGVAWRWRERRRLAAIVARWLPMTAGDAGVAGGADGDER